MTIENATQAYEKNMAEVLALSVNMLNALSRHAQAQAKDPNNWGYVGDLEFIKSQVQNVMGFLQSVKD